MKKGIVKLSLIISILSISCSLLAQEDARQVIDSLSTKANNTEGEEKLSILFNLSELEFFSPNLLSRLDELEKEAKDQKNNRYLLNSYNSRIAYYIRVNNTDSIGKYIALSAPIVKELDPTDHIVARHESLKVVNYTSRGLFDLALINQRKYLEKIGSLGNVKPKILFSLYIGIGETYFEQENYGEALKYFTKSKDLIQAGDNNPLSEISTLCLVALCQVYLKNYADAIRFCDLANETINNNQKTIANDSRIHLNAYIDLIAIQTYSGLKDFNKAKPLAEKLIANIDASYYQDPQAYYYRSVYNYYSEIKEYDEALKYNELGLDQLKNNNNIITQVTFIKEKSSLLYNKREYKKAYDELLYATQIADSIKKNNSAMQLDELAIIYEVNLKDAEIAKAKIYSRYTQSIVIAFIVISILLSIILLIYRANSKKQNAKNKVLFKQQEDLNRAISYYKKMIVDETNNSITNINPIFQQIEKHMLEKEPYKFPNISREDLALALNTNRQYLSSAIKDETGLTFTNYINKYRLENARKLLLENDELIIDDIIIESGFSSRPTFHRLFKNQYGMAPHEFKLAAMSLRDEITQEIN